MSDGKFVRERLQFIRAASDCVHLAKTKTIPPAFPTCGQFQKIRLQSGKHHHRLNYWFAWTAFYMETPDFLFSICFLIEHSPHRLAPALPMHSRTRSLWKFSSWIPNEVHFRLHLTKHTAETVQGLRWSCSYYQVASNIPCKLVSSFQ